MDVQCERCKTEYEFDDALVSGRGTTVKCTNCGFQFKVRPASDGAIHERWTVRTETGTELVFTTLRELQRAISGRKVGRGDQLRRGEAPPRRVGDIAELEPFFPDLDRTELAQPVRATVPGLAGTTPAEESSAANGPGVSAFAHTALAAETPKMGLSPSARDRPTTLRPPLGESAAVPPAAPARLAPVRIPSAPPLGAEPRTEEREALSPPTVPIRSGDPSFSDAEANDPLAPDPIYSVAPHRRRVGGWIVAVVLLTGVSIIGYNVARPYLGSEAKGSAASLPLDPRATRFLVDGERAMVDGNLDLAKENFDKASALAEKDPHVRLDAARLAAARADIPWLKLRLLPEAASDDIRDTRQQLDDMRPALGKASDDALSAAPDDPAAMRVKVDVLRILGERDAARRLVGKLGSTSQPETAYVLAALDSADVGPLWTTVIDRLRVATAGEGNLGRARAALVYALTRAGDTVEAKAELDRLASLPRPHPLVAALRAFLGEASGKATFVGAAPAASGASVSIVAATNVPPRAGAGETTDARVLLQQAAEAENRGQLSRAAKLYEDALRSDGRSSEALAGLGSVALKQGDNATARAEFGKALALNPNYLPALVGQADALWAEGEQNAAVSKYKDVVERFPESSGFPSYVKTRAAGSASGVPGATSTRESRDSGATPASSHPGELTLPSNVPSDLPGSSR